MRRGVFLKVTQWLFMLLCFFIVPVYAQEAEQMHVAVLNLESSGIDSTLSVIFSDRLRTELMKTGKFDVIERNLMTEILEEQGFQQTGACSDDAYVVQAGKILGVSHMIAGSIGKIGELYAISIRLIDVELARILASTSEDSPGPLEKVLTNTIRSVAQKMAALAAFKETSFGKRERAMSGFGEIVLESDPPGAKIFIDGEPVSGTTPLIIKKFKVGVHVIRMQKELYAASKAVFVAPDEVMQVNLKLSLAKGNIKIVSDPPDAQIFLDNQTMGTTPKTLFDLTLGAYSLKLMKEGFESYKQFISVKENETPIILAKLLPHAFLSIKSDPVDCQFFIEDSLMGKTPIEKLKIKPGTHRIKLAKPGYTSYIETKSFPAGELTELNIHLKPVAKLIIHSEPSEMEVFLDGVYKGETPFELDNLAAGRIHLKLVGESFEPWMKELDLLSGETRKVKATLSPKLGKLLVESIPSNAIVEIDGSERGTTPLEIAAIEYGEHLVRILKQNYTPYQEKIQINTPYPKVVRAEFEIARGTLFLQLTPGDAYLFLDGKIVDNIPAGGFKLLPGEYQIRAKRAGYENFLASVNVEPQRATTFEVKLPKKSALKASLRSALLPGWGQRYAGKKARQKLFPILTLVALGGTVYTDYAFDTLIRDYHSAESDYRLAISSNNIESYRNKMDDTYDKMKSAKDLRKSFIIAAVGFWLLNIIDSVVFKPIMPETPNYDADRSLIKNKRLSFFGSQDYRISLIGLQLHL